MNNTRPSRWLFRCADEPARPPPAPAAHMYDPPPPRSPRRAQLTLKSMNSARSAFCSVMFKTSSFDLFTVSDGPTLQTAVLAKHLMAAGAYTRPVFGST